MQEGFPKTGFDNNKNSEKKFTLNKLIARPIIIGVSSFMAGSILPYVIEGINQVASEGNLSLSNLVKTAYPVLLELGFLDMSINQGIELYQDYNKYNKKRRQ